MEEIPSKKQKNPGIAVALYPCKYRLWDKKEKKFWHDFRIHPMGLLMPASSEADGKWIYASDYPQEDLVLCEALNLEDKNLKPIFSGDIVKWSFMDMDNPQAPDVEAGIGEIVYDDFFADYRIAVDRFMPDTYTGAGSFEFWADGDLWSLEVVGNVYENPELLDEVTRHPR